MPTAITPRQEMNIVRNRIAANPPKTVNDHHHKYYTYLLQEHPSLSHAIADKSCLHAPPTTNDSESRFDGLFASVWTCDRSFNAMAFWHAERAYRSVNPAHPPPFVFILHPSSFSLAPSLYGVFPHSVLRTQSL
jgi:hypothetical protein